MSTDELLKTLGEIYVYGYPLVLMDLTKQVATNIERPHPNIAKAPINQLGHFRQLPDHTLTAVVKPNVDTYYSIAWLDLTQGPQVLSMPATDRYYLLSMLDAYSNVFASPGTRTTGTEAIDLLIAGPDWEGETPQNLQLVKAPTHMVWMLGRIQVNSETDGETVVRAIQDRMSLIPFNFYNNKDYKAQEGKVNHEYDSVIPAKAIQELDIKTYFNKMSELMMDNPPPIADSLIVQKMKKVGLVAGKPFNMNVDNLIIKAKMKALPNYLHKRFRKIRENPDPDLLNNGWTIVTKGIGKYGTDYRRRAYIDFIGLGASLPEDAIYPNLTFDINGDRLDASKNYRIHFKKEQLPPVHAFWSLTAYNEDEFLVENSLNRYAVGDRDDLIYNEDGSLDLYIQSDRPSKNISNWLPIPQEGTFYLTLRLYYPKDAALNGHWELPHIVPVEDAF